MLWWECEADAPSGSVGILTEPPCVLVIVPVTVSGSQLSGPIRNSPRSSCNMSAVNCSGTLSTTLGNRSLAIVIRPV